MSDMRKASKQEWNAQVDNLEAINAGSFQRIADAIEKMAANYDNIRNDRDWYKRRYEEERSCNKRQTFRIAALRGVITRMKKAKNAA